jgi:uncharacterized protein YcaQ
MTESLSLAAARRIALAAQGFGRPRPPSVGIRQLNGLFDRLRLLQIDSVNVFERSHYLPAFARLGSYDKALLDRLTMRAGGPYVEYWAHEAAFVPTADLGLFAFRMRHNRESATEWLEARRELAAEVLAELKDRGPLAASEIEHEENRRVGPWWGWSDVKRLLETLFRQGDVVSAGRRGFERRYGLPEHVLGAPPEPVHERDAVRELVRRAAVAHGVGTLADLADYYRLRSDNTRQAVRDLEESGELVPVAVRGWERGDRPLPAWRAVAARAPRRIEAAALLSPFDPVVWERPRAERLFGFHYRISIYTPAAEREHGYYVLPALVDDRIVGRIDLKSDRQAGVLRVQHAWREPDAPDDVAERLAPVLLDAARWQGLETVEVAGRGDLAAPLAAALR